MFKDVLLAIEIRLKADTAIKAKVGDRVYRTLPATGLKYPLIALSKISGKGGSPTSTSLYGVYGLQTTVMSRPTPPTDAEAAEIDDLIAASLSTERDGGIENEYLSAGDTKAAVYVSSVEDRGSTPENSDAALLGIFRESHTFVVNYKIE
jgi:hypothetical protein